MTPTYMTASDIATAFDTGNERKTWSCRKFTTNDLEQVIFKVGSDLIELTYNCTTMRTEVNFKRFTGSWGDYCKAITRSYFYVLHCLKRGGIPLTLPEKYDECTIVVRLDGEAKVRTFVEYAPSFKATLTHQQRAEQILADPDAVQRVIDNNALLSNLICSNADLYVDTSDDSTTLPLVEQIHDTEETQQENTDD